MIGPAPNEGSGAACAVTSAPVTTRTTPGSASAFEVSMLTMRAWACGLRTIAAWAMSGQADVVDVAALAAEEPRVLDPVDALPEPAALAGLLQRRLGRDARRGGKLLDGHAFAATDWIASTICW